MLYPGAFLYVNLAAAMSVVGSGDGSPGDAGVGLVATTKTASTSSGARLVRRYALQNEARRLLPEHRVGCCMRVLRPGAAGVDVLFDAQHKAAHYGGLMRCGSAWVCPVCAAVITERRADELRQALERHPELTPVMLTVTLQHGTYDRLDELLEALKGGMRFVRAGRSWQALKAELSIAGSITSTEVTYGAHGWHPHEHILILSRLPLDELPLEALRSAVAERFGVYLQRLGRYVSPEFGVQAVAGNAAVASYVSKWDAACELTKSNVKQSRSDGGSSPWMLLAASSGGDERAGRLFQEYASALFGRRLLTYTRGLKAELGIGDITDEALVEKDEEQAVVLATLTVHQWRRVLANDARAELLVVAARGDAEALGSWLAQFWQGAISTSDA